MRIKWLIIVARASHTVTQISVGKASCGVGPCMGIPMGVWAHTHTHTHHESVPTTMGVGYMVGSPVHTHIHTHHGSAPTMMGMGIMMGWPKLTHGYTHKTLSIYYTFYNIFYYTFITHFITHLLHFLVHILLHIVNTHFTTLCGPLLLYFFPHAYYTAWYTCLQGNRCYQAVYAYPLGTHTHDPCGVIVAVMVVMVKGDVELIGRW